jgi:hypothetical protein
MLTELRPVDGYFRAQHLGVTRTVQVQENGGNRAGQLSLRLDF